MIQFSCACGMKFKVKEDFAGRKTHCPTCKQPLVVPTPDGTQAYVPPGQIDGTPSSIAQAGLDGGVTLEPERAARATRSRFSELLNRRTKSKERYIIEKEIARGGMGAVLRAVDCDIRREVAVKYLLDQSDPKKKLRFIEEAQITGQLEHPNIVAGPRTWRRCPEAPVLLDEDGQGPQPGPSAGRPATEPEDGREGVHAGPAAEHLGRTSATAWPTPILVASSTVI